jgi:hypothetical protein
MKNRVVLAVMTTDIDGDVTMMGGGSAEKRIG